MARTTATEVQSILADQYDPTINLDSFINTATLIVSRVNTCATSKGYTLSDDELRMLEALLSAHLYGSADRFYTSRSTGKASGSFMGQSGLGLDNTLYGQNAKLVDPSGCLAAMDKKQRATLTWLGKKYSERLDYDERN